MLSSFNFFSFTSNQIVDLCHKKSNKNFNLSFRTIDRRRVNCIKFNIQYFEHYLRKIGDVYGWWNKWASEWTFSIWWLMEEWRQRMNKHKNNSEQIRKSFACVCTFMEKRLTCWVNVDVNLITSNNLSSEMNHFRESKYKHIAVSIWPIFFFWLTFSTC